MDRVILVTGTVGAGKTTTVEAMSGLLWERRVPHATVDLDAISILRPPPADDGFNGRVMLRNVQDLSRNYAAAGARVLVLAGVVENAGELDRLTRAVGGPVSAVRLVGPHDVTAARLRIRHGDDESRTAWHLDRTVELDEVLDRWTDPTRVDTTDLTPRQVAERVLAVTAESR